LIKTQLIQNWKPADRHNGNKTIQLSATHEWCNQTRTR